MFTDIDAHDEYGKTPLHCAVGAQKLDIVQCLLRYRPDVDAHDDRDDTALHTAARSGNLEIVMVSETKNGQEYCSDKPLFQDREGSVNPSPLGY